MLKTQRQLLKTQGQFWTACACLAGMRMSPVDLMLEYGPTADANYRRYLRGKYGTAQAV